MSALTFQIRLVGWLLTALSILLAAWGVLCIVQPLVTDCTFGDGQNPNLGEGIHAVFQMSIFIGGVLFLVFARLYYTLGRQMATANPEPYSWGRFIQAALLLIVTPVGAVVGLYTLILLSLHNRRVRHA
jgi:uncharacterized membrane protein YidH (DUF202 family)